MPTMMDMGPEIARLSKEIARLQRLAQETEDHFSVWDVEQPYERQRIPKYALPHHPRMRIKRKQREQ